MKRTLVSPWRIVSISKQDGVKNISLSAIIKVLRTAQGLSIAELSRRASMSDRAIRYIEAGEREPSVDAIQKIAAALGVTTDYFMDDATFQKELSDDQFYADVRKKYGSRGVAQAKKIKEQTSALFAGGELFEEDQADFIKEMEALFLDAKAERRTNTFAAELLLSDDGVLKPIGFYEFNADRLQMEASLPPH